MPERGAELVAGQAKKREPLAIRWHWIAGTLNHDLGDLVAGEDFDRDLFVAELDLVSAATAPRMTAWGNRVLLRLWLDPQFTTFRLSQTDGMHAVGTALDILVTARE